MHLDPLFSNRAVVGGRRRLASGDDAHCRSREPVALAPGIRTRLTQIEWQPAASEAGDGERAILYRITAAK